jgi:selenocysteine-specific elongation factor
MGQEVEIVPGDLRARIRGLQTHKHKITEAVPGSRVAMNLSGVRADQVSRGQVVALPDTVRPTWLVDLRIRLLPDSSVPLKHNQEVDFFSGAAEVSARTRLLNADEVSPGGEGWLQLRLAEPVALAAGDRFIVRQPSPSRTLGGGQVVNPHPRRRHRRFRPETVAHLETLARGDPLDIVLQALEEREPAGAREVVSQVSLEEDVAIAALDSLLASGQASLLQIGDVNVQASQAVAGNRYLVSAAGWRRLSERIRTVLAEYHDQRPLRLGMPREELKSRLQPRQPWHGRVFNELVERAVAEGIVVDTAGTIGAATHQVRFSPEQAKRVEMLLDSFRSQPYTPPSMVEAAASVGADVLQALIDAKTLTRVGDDVLFVSETYEEMVERVLVHLRSEGSITVAQVRDMFGTSRKYALPLMEHLDERRLTRRVGDQRVLR